jgi:hypothetical protein
VIQNYKIDQARTFGSLMLLGVSPKLVFGDNARQETTKAGVPKWVAQLAAEFRAFGRPVRELINVTIDAEKDPGQGIAPGTFMELIDFEIGVMEKRNRDGQVVGVQVWYRASAMRPTSATSNKPQPAMAASGGA